MVKNKSYLATTLGKRKSSIARVYVSQGEGKIVVNGRDFREYFPRGVHQYVVTQPLELLKVQGEYDIQVNATGGGHTGQAGAVRLGVARALQEIDEARRAELKKAGFLTRDSRKVERKKYGLSGARKSYQFSKR